MAHRMGAKILSLDDARLRYPCRSVGTKKTTPLDRAFAALGSCDTAADFATKLETFRRTLSNELDKHRFPAKPVGLGGTNGANGTNGKNGKGVQ